ncbi:hypothetical protein [Geobacter sp. SVR]|uniref:hypothetical protein n=1 Tax=Geobacter sp. SVR TaxID=2495594 RepID=UPI00143EF9AE|nr:hypothetical protein [Geobacter sp. SVR]BCS55758.1 hypothetical protein GSVR_40660 [Geobacter sp. SVR]GCF83762.1 hypothetical protein GSbR_03620 [Geobacter sp. SVR]
MGHKEGDTEKRDETKRRSGYAKAAGALVRTCHIGITAILFGGAVLAVPVPNFMTWHNWAIASGIALILLGVYQSRHWPYQGRGLMAAVHVALIGVLHARQELAAPLLTVILALGGIGSNMPGSLRHWSILHGRRVD